MIGDYKRYLAEFKSDSVLGKESGAAYSEAWEMAKQGLSATDPIRLGLVLNYAVYQYEIANNPMEAYALAKRAFDDAITKLDTLDEHSYKESTLIMQQLRDKCSLWEPKEEEL